MNSSSANPDSSHFDAQEASKAANDFKKNPEAQGFVINTGADFAMETLAHPSPRQQDLMNLWNRSSAEDQEKFLTGSITLERLLMNSNLLTGMIQAFRDMKFWLSVLREETPEDLKNCFKAEIKAYVALGILKCKNTAALAHVDNDAKAVGRLTRALVVAAQIAGFPELGEVIAVLSKMADFAGEYLGETFPKVRAEVARRQSLKQVSKTQAEVQGDVQNVLNTAPSNNTDRFEQEPSTNASEESASTPSQAAA